MSEHKATVAWRRTTEGFGLKDYYRAHEWRFEHGLTVPASSAPEFRGDADRIDPEKAFVAALSSCHMLFVLFLCAQQGIVVESYEDDAVGVLEKGPDGKFWITRVTLRPRIAFADPARAADLPAIHHQAHERCYIASSSRTEITIEPQ